GMQRELLRASHHRRAKSVEQIVSSSNTICTLDLLRNEI
ncbi:unnamed protein product, partial [Rotaria sp. Silwood2]